VRWINDNGGFVHPAVVVGRRGDGVRGVFVTHDVGAGEELIRLPEALWRSSVNEAAGRVEAFLDPRDEGEADDEVDELRTTALSLLIRERDAPDGHIVSLPGRGPLESVTLCWTLEQLAALRHPEAIREIQAQQRRVKILHEELLVSARHNPRRRRPQTLPLLLRDWYWAITMVSSRACADAYETCYDADDGAADDFPPAEGTILPPLVDCINHAPPPEHTAAGAAVCNAEFEYMFGRPTGASEEGSYRFVHESQKYDKCVTLLQPLRGGDEVLLSYKALNVQSMLLLYGSIPDALGAAPFGDYFWELSKHTARTRERLAALRAREPLAVTVRAQCAKHALHAAREDAAVRRASNEPARLAALYRRCRALALGRAFVAAVPRDDAAAVQAAVAAGVTQGVRDAVAQHCFAGAPAGAADAFSAGALDIMKFCIPERRPPTAVEDEIMDNEDTDDDSPWRDMGMTLTRWTVRHGASAFGRWKSRISVSVEGRADTQWHRDCLVRACQRLHDHFARTRWSKAPRHRDGLLCGHPSQRQPGRAAAALVSESGGEFAPDASPRLPAAAARACAA
jgi:hypothetical protein